MFELERTVVDSCSAESGTCSACINACKSKPGWFAPGEVEKVAEFLGLSLADLFRTKLGVDWWEADDFMNHQVFLLAPAPTGREGRMYPGTPRGRCVFLTQDNRCEIHPVKPQECRETWCTEERSINTKRRQGIVKAWDEHQDQVQALLGDEPQSSPYEPLQSIFDRFGF